MRLSPGTIAKGAIKTTRIDLTDAANLIVTRAGVAFAQTGDNTAATVAANTPIIERALDGWDGVWSHPQVDNYATPGDFSDFALGNSATMATGQASPDGGSTAIKITDANPSGTGFAYKGLNPTYVALWAREDPANLPTGPGAITTSATQADAFTQPVVGSAWTRYEFTTNGMTAVQLYPAGLSPGPTFDGSKTGAAFYWGLFADWNGTWLRPCAKTTLPAAGVKLTPARVAELCTDGTFDLEHEWLPSGTFGSVTLWSASGGLHSLRHEYPNLILKVGGVDRLSAPSVEGGGGGGTGGALQVPKRGHLVRIRCKWNTLRNECLIRMSVGGAVAFDWTTTTTGGLLAAFTDFWIGCDNGTAGFATLRHRGLNARASGPHAFRPEGIVLGDSTTASWASQGLPSVASYYFDDLAQEGDHVRCLAVPGESITQQMARWSALPAYERAGAAYILLQLGINDLADPAATILSRLQSGINTINAERGPNAKVIAAPMTPCKASINGSFGSGAYTRWQDVNAATMGLTLSPSGNAVTPISGVHARSGTYVATLDDGAGNLAAPWDIGDNLHPNALARQVIAADHVSTFKSLGLM
jgi:lysophospholipase L1-like esterase